MTELNLQAFAKRLENRAAAFEVLPSSTDLAYPLSSQSYAKPESMGPQNHRDGQHPDTLITDSRALLDNRQDAMHSVATFSGKREFIKHTSHNKTYMLEERPHTMELCIYHGIKVQVDGLEGECICQMCRCTGSQSWRGGDPQNDWVRVKQRPGRCYDALIGRLPWQPQRLIQLKLVNEDRAFVEYWSARVLTIIPENSVNLYPVLHFLLVRNAPAAVALQVFSVGYIVGHAHVIPQIATGIVTGDGRNEWWIVNSYNDLATWNDVYN